MEENIVHRSFFSNHWKRLVGRPSHRWKILRSAYIRCKVADGIDLVRGACKPRMNVHSVCNVGSFLYLQGNCLLFKKAVLRSG